MCIIYCHDLLCGESLIYLDARISQCSLTLSSRAREQSLVAVAPSRDIVLVVLVGDVQVVQVLEERLVHFYCVT